MSKKTAELNFFQNLFNIFLTSFIANIAWFFLNLETLFIYKLKTYLGIVSILLLLVILFITINKIIKLTKEMKNDI